MKNVLRPTRHDSKPWRSQKLVLLGAALHVLSACDENKTSPPDATLGRSEVVLASKGAPSAKAQPSAPVQPAATDLPARKSLCDSRPMTDFPSAKLNALNTSGTSLGESAPVRGLTWVNLWAAWCEPCKKEIPMMVEFQSKLRGAGVPVSLAFVSMDDDQRQLELFLKGGAAKGMRETFWLSEGKARDQWLTDLGLSADPRLPVHFLVNASRQVFCRIEGSVQADDFPLVLAELQKSE